MFTTKLRLHDPEVDNSLIHYEEEEITCNLQCFLPYQGITFHLGHRVCNCFESRLWKNLLSCNGLTSTLHVYGTLTKAYNLCLTSLNDLTFNHIHNEF